MAFLLDAKIRNLTGGEKSLDDVMQLMFSMYAESGYLPADFRDVASEVTGEELDDWFMSTVDSTDDLVFEDVTVLGVELAGIAESKSASGDDDSKSDEPKDQDSTEEESEDKKSKDEAGAEVEDDADEKGGEKAVAEKAKAKSKKPPTPKAWLGIRASESSGRVTISSIQSDSPATVAGLNTGDEIIALNDFRVTSSIDSRLKQYKIGDEVELLIARRGKLMKISIAIGTDPKQNWGLTLISKPSDEQKAALKDWLGKPESDE